MRTGAASAREVVEAALRRIEALDPASTRSSRSTASGRSPPPTRSCRATRAVRGRADRDQGQRAGRGLRAQQRLALPRRLPPGPLGLPGAAPARGGVRDRRDHQPARVRDPADDRAAPHRPDPQPVGPRRARPAAPAGGSAAAVAAGMVPLAHGNDGGGSIRIPAACCGLVGLKPSRGRVSSGPDLGESWLAANGVLTRTVADTAIALDVLGGYEVGDANWAPRPIEPYVTAMRRSPGQAARGGDGDEPVRAPTSTRRRSTACASARSCCAALGHEVVEAAPVVAAPEALEVFISVFGPAVALGIDAGVRRAGRDPEEDELEPLSRALYERAQGDAVARLPRAPSRSCRRSRAGSSRSSPTTTCCSRPAGRAPAARSASATGSASDPMARPRALGPLHALHVAVQRHRPAGDLAAGRLRRRRPADRRADRRQAARRGHAAAGRRADGGRAPLGAPGAPSRSSSRRTSADRAAGGTPSASASVGRRARSASRRPAAAPRPR